MDVSHCHILVNIQHLTITLQQPASNCDIFLHLNNLIILNATNMTFPHKNKQQRLTDFFQWGQEDMCSQPNEIKINHKTHYL